MNQGNIQSATLLGQAGAIGGAIQGAGQVGMAQLFKPTPSVSADWQQNTAMQNAAPSISES
jgi:hypothetical protein